MNSIETVKTKAVLSVSVVLAAASCEMLPAGHETGLGQDRIPVEVTVPQTMSKVLGIADEDKVNSLQVYVFRENGMLDASSSSDGNSLVVECNSGDMEFVALANAPVLTGITTRSQLLEARTLLQDNSVSGFVMYGSAMKSVSPGNDNVDITVARFAARISVKKVTNALGSGAYQDVDIVLKRIYLANAAGDIRYSGTGEPLVWLNKSGVCTDIPALLSSGDLGSVSITNGESYGTRHYFYCYPNGTQEDTASPEWSPRYTRLVLETEILGKTFYYPVSIPDIKANHTYDLEDVRITRLGSTSPDIPVETGSVSVTVHVKPWDEGSSSEVII